MQTTFTSAAVRLTVLSLFFSVTALFAQGPLSPPPGPPAPTMKSLDQIEPRVAINATNTPGDASSLFRITQPGSYFLTQNVIGVAAKSGITITVTGVTVDLNGFSLTGITGSQHGIHVPGVVRGLNIRNGSITGWDGAGVNGGSAIISEFESLRVYNNDGDGLVIGSASMIKDCVAQDMGGSGLRAAAGSILVGCTSLSNVTGITAVNSTVRNCLVRQNTGVGLSLSGLSTVADCLVTANGGNGIVVTNNEGSITHCTVSGNGADGINIPGGSVTGCTAESNSGAGIRTGAGAASVRDCVTKGNGAGIVTQSGASIVGCSAKSNVGDGIVAGEGSSVVVCSASQNGGHGISGGLGCTVSDSTASANSGTGISMAAGRSVVSRCTVNGNAQHGIIAEHVNGCDVSGNNLNGIQVSAGNGQGFIFENTCSSNGFGGVGAGIFVASGNRIEGNNVIGNGKGIEVTGMQNLIIRNSARSNGPNGTKNYVIAAGNRYPPIVDITAQNGPGFTGTQAPDNMGVNHPWANFSY